MFGEFDCFYIYGFKDIDYGNNHILCDFKELEDLGIGMYATNIISMHMNYAVYGIVIEPGMQAKNEEIQNVVDAMNFLNKKYDMGGCVLGYYVGIQGDYEIEQVPYQLRDRQKLEYIGCGTKKLYKQKLYKPTNNIFFIEDVDDEDEVLFERPRN
jgi:hypothetical protein